MELQKKSIDALLESVAILRQELQNNQDSEKEIELLGELKLLSARIYIESDLAVLGMLPDSETAVESDESDYLIADEELGEEETTEEEAHDDLPREDVSVEEEPKELEIALNSWSEETETPTDTPQREEAVIEPVQHDLFFSAVPVLGGDVEPIVSSEPELVAKNANEEFTLPEFAIPEFEIPSLDLIPIPEELGNTVADEISEISMGIEAESHVPDFVEIPESVEITELELLLDTEPEAAVEIAEEIPAESHVDKAAENPIERTHSSVLETSVQANEDGELPPPALSGMSVEAIVNQMPISRRFEFANLLFGGDIQRMGTFIQEILQAPSGSGRMDVYERWYEENNWRRRDEAASDMLRLIKRIFPA